ncbi:unnamed protein product [Prunus armeniaca]
MMPAHGVTFSLLFLLFLATVLTTTEASLTHANGSAAVAAAATDKKDKVEPLVPLVGAENFKTLVMNETRRRLRSFQICALCTCCGGAKGLCLPSPCCYAINCNIPNRPFGFCSFTPKTSKTKGRIWLWLIVLEFQVGLVKHKDMLHIMPFLPKLQKIMY